GSICRSSVTQRQPDDELRTATRGVASPDVPVVRGHGLPDDGKTETRASRLQRVVGLEDPLDRVGGYAAPVVTDDDLDLFADPTRAQLDPPAVRAVLRLYGFNCVAQHVAQRTQQRIVVTEQGGQLRLDVEARLDPLRDIASRQGAKQLADIDLARRPLGRPAEDGKAARELLESGRLLLDDLDGIRECRVRPGGPPQPVRRQS